MCIHIPVRTVLNVEEVARAFLSDFQIVNSYEIVLFLLVSRSNKL